MSLLKFTDCDECTYFDCLPLNHKLNSIYLNFKKIFNILNIFLPPELSLIIIKMNDNIRYCTCKERTKLCDIHFDRALHNGTHYGKYGALCSNCCWNEI